MNLNVNSLRFWEMSDERHCWCPIKRYGIYFVLRSRVTLSAGNLETVCRCHTHCPRAPLLNYSFALPYYITHDHVTHDALYTEPLLCECNRGKILHLSVMKEGCITCSKSPTVCHWTVPSQQVMQQGSLLHTPGVKTSLHSSAVRHAQLTHLLLIINKCAAAFIRRRYLP